MLKIGSYYHLLFGSYRDSNARHFYNFIFIYTKYHFLGNCPNYICNNYNYIYNYNIIYIYGKVYEKRDLACIIKKYNKNALRLICYNFRTVNAITFLFSTLHTAPFLYRKVHFGVLHLLRVSIATFDIPLGSNLP